MKTNKHIIYGKLFLMLLFISCTREEVESPINVDFSYEIVGANYEVPVQVSFRNTTTGADSYKWIFEGGEPGVYEKKDPGTITFTKAGAVKVKLEAWRDGERKEKEITIVLDNPLKAKFSITPEINTYGLTTFKIVNESVGASAFTWSFIGEDKPTITGKDPAPVQFTQPGTYRVHLEAKNERGRIDTISHWVTVYPALSSSFTLVM